ncbi:hypothetical protein GS416_05720 [Rhodococcus hoagii]|nr:hypothetical protein [Prescottella equi]
MLDQMWSPALVYSFGGVRRMSTTSTPLTSQRSAIRRRSCRPPRPRSPRRTSCTIELGHDAAAAISTLAEIHAAITAMADEDPEEPPTPTDEELDAEAEG